MKRYISLLFITLISLAGLFFLSAPRADAAVIPPWTNDFESISSSPYGFDGAIGSNVWTRDVTYAKNGSYGMLRNASLKGLYADLNSSVSSIYISTWVKFTSLSGTTKIFQALTSGCTSYTCEVVEVWASSGRFSMWSIGPDTFNDSGVAISLDTWYLVQARIDSGSSAFKELKITPAGGSTTTVNGTVSNNVTGQVARVNMGSVSDGADTSSSMYYDTFQVSTTGYPNGSGTSVTTTGNAGYSYNYFYSAGTINNQTGATVTYGTAWGAGSGYSGTACSALPNKTDYSTVANGYNGSVNAYVSANPSTLYYFCVYAKDGSNNYYYSPTSPAWLTTSAPQPPTMERFTKGEITSNAANNFTGYVGNQNGATLSAVGFCYSSSNATPALNQGGTTCTNNGTGSTGSSFSGNLTPLSPNTLYYVRSYGTNSGGTGYSGSVDTFTTETTPPAGYPQIVSTIGFYDRNDSTTHNVVMPAIVDAGDLLVALISSDGSATVTVPSGWTQLFTTANSTSLRLGTYYKFAAGTEDGTTVNFQTSASESMAAQVYRITGALAVESGTAVIGTSTAPNPPILTPSWGAKDTLWIPVVAYEQSATLLSVYSSSYTHGRRDGDTYSSSTTWQAAGSARRYLNASSEDPGAFTLLASVTWLANTIAIRPEPTTPNVTTNAADPVGQTTATIKGNANPNTFATTGWFRYYTSDPVTCADSGGTRAPSASGTDLGSGSTGVDYSRNLTGLTPGTEYWVCAIASNTNGTGVGSPVRFDTAVGTPTSVTAGSGGQTSPWYNNSWNYRVPITVLSAKVGASLTDFPVYVDLSNLPVAFFTNVKSDGSDIRVTTSDTTTEVPREVVTIDTVGRTGELHFKGNISSSSNTTFYIYYGNASATEPAASATYGSQNVWNSAYKGVYHLANGTTLSPNDSTATAVNGTITGATATTGQIDGGGSFDGVNDKIDINSVYGLGNTNVTISAWVNLPDTSESGAFVKIGNESGSNIGFALGVGNTTFDTEGNNLVMLYEGIRWINTSSALGTGLHYVVMTVDASGVPSAYKDGAFISSYSGTNAAAPTTGATKIGGYTGSGAENRFGQYGLDEVRVSNTPRASTWISTEYNNQSSPATFYSVGSEANLGATPPETGSYFATLEGSANPNNFASYGFFRLYTTDPVSCTDSGGTRIPALEGSDIPLGSGNTSQGFSYNASGAGEGLAPNDDYWYCAFARNAYGTVASSGSDTFSTPDGANAPCDTPTSGDHTILGSCSYTGNIAGVDAGSGTGNTAKISSSPGRILTINAGQTVATGVFYPSGGVMSIAVGGALRPNAPIWVIDADGDGYIANNEQYIGAQPAGGVRRNTVSTAYPYFSKILSATTDVNATIIRDCNDNTPYAYRMVPNLVTDADQDGYKTAAAAGPGCVGADAIINGRTYYNDGSGPN